jgi:MOSC domain-containing protein YiiM
MGRIVAVAVGERPGLKKRPVEVGRLMADHGLVGDRHAGPGPRQVSLLDARVADLLRSMGIAVEPGDLGENLLLADVPLGDLQPGARLRVGGAVVEITEVRRPCRSVREVDPRALKALVGHAGQMARVVSSGDIRPGDSVAPIDA